MRVRVRSVSVASAVVAFASSLALVALPSAALAQGKDAREKRQACVASAEKAQQLKIDGKLVEARKELMFCASEECPGAIRSDCASWLGQVNALIPTIVLVARDAAGEDLADVRVTMDGEPFASRLEGKSLSAGPGEHVFRFERAGTPAVEKRVILREGDSARKIEIVFGGPPPAVAAVPKPTTTVEAREKKGAGPLPWIIVGVGGAAAATGVVMYVVGSGAPPAGCLSGLCDNRFDDGTPNSTASGRTVSGSTESCASIPTANGCSRSAYNQKRQSDAGQLNGFKVVGIITAASGGVLAAGGLVYYLLARPKAQETAWLVPFVTERSQGLAVEGRF